MSKRREISYQLLHKLYIEKGFTIDEITKELRCGHSTVRRELKKYGLTKSNKDYKAKHGMSNSRAYKIWQQMKNRCDNPKNIKYPMYGAKGISYPDKWKTFDGFWDDIAEGYKDNLTLDRIDGSKSYSKENCRWISYKGQNSNKANNVNVSIKELMDLTGLSQSTIYRRLRDGWNINKIINTPKLTYNGRESYDKEV